MTGVEWSSFATSREEWLALSVKLRSTVVVAPVRRRLAAGSDVVLRVRIPRGCVRLPRPAGTRLVAWARGRLYGWICQ